MTLTASHIDRSVFRDVLTANTSPDDWSRWFKDLQIQMTPSETLLVAPSRFIAHQVTTRFLADVESAARAAGAVGPGGMRVTVAPASRPRPHVAPDPVVVQQPERPPHPSPPKSRHPSSHHRFDNFEVGPSNLLAHAAAASVARDPGGDYNPLYIYGASGLGKTHLLLAIAHRVRRDNPDLKVRYSTSEQFVQQFIQSISNRAMDSFRNRYRKLDILILDDFQFLQGKEQTLEEFFWTFDSLYQRGKHVVLGCDRSPRELNAIADRTRSRVSAGLITRIGSPDLDTRMAILRSLNERSSTPLPDEVLQIVGNRITNNIRDLASALQQLQAYTQLTNLPVTADTVIQQLAPLSRRLSTPRSPDNIISVCAEAFNTSVEEMLDYNRRPVPSEARQVAMYLTRQLTGMPFARIGAAFNRGHSTILSAHRRVSAQIAGDARFADRVTAIYNLIHNS